MKYIEAPENLERTLGYKSIFLAGGITGCPNWQQEVVLNLHNADLILLNPRRENFPINDPDAAREQITWEHNHLRKADAILFWFPCETLCPIVLYELGAWSMSAKPIFVGVHPGYQRRQDVEIQTILSRPEVEIVYSLGDLVRQVREWECYLNKGDIMNEEVAKVKAELERQQMLAYAQQELNQQILGYLYDALAELRKAKPKERNELARRYAVTITEMEKVVAYFQVYVCGDE